MGRANALPAAAIPATPGFTRGAAQFTNCRMRRGRGLALLFGPLGLLVFAVGACATTGAREDPSRAGAASASASSSAAARTPPPIAEAGAAEPAPPADVTAFHVFAEGACPALHPYAVGAAPVIVMHRSAWTIGPTAVTPFYRMGKPVYDRLSGTFLTGDHIGDVGGPDPEHSWLQLRLSSGRGEDMSEVLVKQGAEWRILPTPHGQYGRFALTQVLPQPDGSLWTFGLHSIYLDIPGDPKPPATGPYDKWFAFSSQGEPLSAHLPGPDMQGVIRLPDGELIAAGRKDDGVAVLRRWSPVKKVDDIVLGKESRAPLEQAQPLLAVGTRRAVFRPAKRSRALYIYSDGKLTPAAMTGRVHDVASWLVTTADELFVAQADGTLFIERPDGAIQEEKLPEPGKLAGEPTVPWLLGTSGALYVRSDAGWRKLGLPDGPWTAATHPPSRLEWVKTLGGETWASAVRTDVGFGRRKAGEVGVLYSSRPHGPPLRCGAPFPDEALAPLPPPAGASCASRVVVVATEPEREAKSAYPKLAAALKGDAALGGTLTFVGFGAGPDRLVGILAPTEEVATELVKKLTGVAAAVPEVVCGAPDEHRRFVLDVKAGTFPPSP